MSTLLTTPATVTCTHNTPCPPADASDHDAAIVIAAHPEQGWFLRCNGIVSFTDTGDLYPDRHCDAPHRNEVRLTGPVAA